MQFAFVFLAQKKSVAPEELIVPHNYIAGFEFRDKIRIFILLDKSDSIANEASALSRFRQIAF